MTRTQSRFGMILGLCIAAILIGLWSSPIGYLAVKYACHKDGGEYVERAVYADGYSIEHQGPRCFECLFDIASKRFAFVDHDIPNKGQHPLSTNAGYNRYSIGKLQSEQCDLWRSSEWFVIRGAGYGLAPDECITLEPVESVAPHRYTYSKTNARGLFFTRLELDQYKIVDMRNGQTLATVRNYGYRPIMKRIWWEWSSPFWQCDFFAQRFRPDEFRQRVLRDESSKLQN